MKVRKDLLGSTNKLDGFDARGMQVRVLVVDDETITRKMVIQVLKSQGYDVIGEAENGLEGVQLYKNLKPDLVTMDVRMPRMDGINALEQIKKINPNAKVVMLTAENDKETVMKLLKGGAANYVVKPIERNILLQKVKEAYSS
jgi:two-component system, chemotaxis family, chemotaxis protein CheY